MKSPWTTAGILAVLLSMVVWLGQPAGPRASYAGLSHPADASASPVLEGPHASRAVPARLSALVWQLPIRHPAPGADREINSRRNPLEAEQDAARGSNLGGPPDPLLAGDDIGAGRTPTPSLSFDGIGNVSSVTPPDPIGAVGTTQYVQIVNATLMAVYDKSGNLLHGPVSLNDLWPSGSCALSNLGDPVVVHDVLADRWVMAQFKPGSGICVAVSQTASALGAFYTYEFSFPQFPDYFKIGVWPDAYYLGSNESSYSAYALDRIKMLSGLPASFVRFTGETNFLMPANVDGPTPPTPGAPGLFYTFKDDMFHGGADRIEIFALHVDFAAPQNSTFTLVDTIDVTPFTYTVCGFFNFDCIPQPRTTQRVDALSEWPMWRLAYRNFGTHETLVANFTIDVGNNRAGIRWYELRNSGAGWVIQQEATHAPGKQHRWMGSIAMDGSGNIALGYSIVQKTLNPRKGLYPSLAYATRLATDPPSTLQTELFLVTGGGSQTGSNRWGDYSAMTVDPVDDCTFWYTGEYYATQSSTGWRTRIGSFKMPGCS